MSGGACFDKLTGTLTGSVAPDDKASEMCDSKAPFDSDAEAAGNEMENSATNFEDAAAAEGDELATGDQLETVDAACHAMEGKDKKKKKMGGSMKPSSSALVDLTFRGSLNDLATGAKVNKMVMSDAQMKAFKEKFGDNISARSILVMSVENGFPVKMGLTSVGNAQLKNVEENHFSSAGSFLVVASAFGKDGGEAHDMPKLMHAAAPSKFQHQVKTNFKDISVAEVKTHIKDHHDGVNSVIPKNSPLVATVRAFTDLEKAQAEKNGVKYEGGSLTALMDEKKNVDSYKLSKSLAQAAMQYYEETYHKTKDTIAAGDIYVNFSRSDIQPSGSPGEQVWTSTEGFAPQVNNKQAALDVPYTLTATVKISF